MRLDKIFTGILVGFIALVGIWFGWYRFTYNWEFNALRRSLEENRYEITGQWRHEDITLEDFGFTIKTTAGECCIDIRDGTQVRVPNDPIEGIGIHYPKEMELRAFLFDSDYWRNLRLPEIKTVSDLLKHLPHVLEAFRTSPPAISHPAGGGNNANHSKYLFLRIPKPPERELPTTYKRF